MRTLKWRIVRGRQWIDLIEIAGADADPRFVGLIDGKEAVRAANPAQAGAALIQAACRG